MYELKLDFVSHAFDHIWSRFELSLTILFLYPCVSFDRHFFRWPSFSLFLLFGSVVWSLAFHHRHLMSVYFQFYPNQIFYSCSYTLFSSSFVSFFRLIWVASFIVIDLYISFRLVSPLPPCSLLAYVLSTSLLICKLPDFAIIFLVLYLLLSNVFTVESRYVGLSEET